jgi:hypothetical protein
MPLLDETWNELPVAWITSPVELLLKSDTGTDDETFSAVSRDCCPRVANHDTVCKRP